MATSTPWGVAHKVTHITRGIRSVSTSGHGGVMVSPKKNLLIPSYMRINSGAYEEDCAWCIPAIVFEAEWREWADSTNWTTGDTQMGCAWSSFKNWYPEMYEEFTGIELKTGESFKRDELTLQQQTQDQFVVVAAWGAWHKQVPDGQIGVCARRAKDGAEKYFLIPAPEYEDRRNTTVGKASCFTIQPHHVETGTIS